MNKQTNLPHEVIVSKICLVRGQNIMLDKDLADLYGVETKYLKRQVRRNIERFPKDFMFEMTKEEFENLRCQIYTSSWGGTRYAPMVFTEQGVSMLSSVLKSTAAIEVNIQIIRTFTRLRELLITHKDLLLKMEQLERRTDSQDERMEEIFQYIRSLIRQNKEQEPRKELGYKSKRIKS